MLAGFAPKDEADLGGSGNAFGQQLTLTAAGRGRLQPSVYVYSLIEIGYAKRIYVSLPRARYDSVPPPDPDLAWLSPS